MSSRRSDSYEKSTRKSSCGTLRPAKNRLQAEAAMKVTIDPKLKTKCPRTALGCVTAQVEAGAAPDALLEEMKAREGENQKLTFPRSVMTAPQGGGHRLVSKAPGEDAALDRGR